MNEPAQLLHYSDIIFLFTRYVLAKSHERNMRFYGSVIAGRGRGTQCPSLSLSPGSRAALAQVHQQGMLFRIAALKVGATDPWETPSTRSKLFPSHVKCYLFSPVGQHLYWRHQRSGGETAGLLVRSCGTNRC